MYKTVEKLYSDSIESMLIHNIFVIMVKRKGLVNIDISGDGTSYGFTMTRHYLAGIKKRKW